jgi:anti-anti-sigma factor
MSTTQTFNARPGEDTPGGGNARQPTPRPARAAARPAAQAARQHRCSTVPHDPACPPPWVSTDTDCETTAITLRGETDIQAAQALHEEVMTALNRGTHVVLDLTEAILIDCACLGMLVRARRQAEQPDRVIAMAAPAPLVERTLRTTLAHTGFPIFRDRHQAVAWLRNRPTDPPGEPPPERLAGDSIASAAPRPDRNRLEPSWTWAKPDRPAENRA